MAEEKEETEESEEAATCCSVSLAPGNAVGDGRVEGEGEGDTAW